MAPFLIDLKISNSRNVGFYTGWLQTVFALSVCIGVLPATYSSDKYGRKPTILLGLTTAAICSVVFPFVGTYPGLLIIRGCLGFFTAFVPVVLKTLFVELSDEKTRPVFFATSSLGASMGHVAA